MPTALKLALLTPLVLLTHALPVASGQGLWKRFMPVKRVAADPQANYSLADTNGPWMVMACTFSGEGAERQARELVYEFRQRFNLPAYAHAMQFDLSGETVGRGIDKYGSPVRMRHKKGDRLQEWAVLVGDFPSIDDPQAQKLLKTIKTVKPQALDPTARGGETTQSLALARASQRLFVPRIGKSKQLGPMRTAFYGSEPVAASRVLCAQGRRQVRGKDEQRRSLQSAEESEGLYHPGSDLWRRERAARRRQRAQAWTQRAITAGGSGFQRRTLGRRDARCELGGLRVS